MRQLSRSFLIAFSASVLVSACMSEPTRRINPSELPMYGGQDTSLFPDVKAIDDAFIEGITKEFGSRDVASERTVSNGFVYYFQDDLSTAMKRFNQGWLLNPNNPNVFHGFSAVLNDRQRHCEARKMIERALELGLEPRAENLADAGRANALCAMLDNSVTQDIKAAYLKRSYNLYVDALKASPENAYVYGSWATASYWMGDHATAWKYVKKQRALGGKPGERFISLLSAKMPEPFE